jgi:hypothetical protein
MRVQMKLILLMATVIAQAQEVPLAVSTLSVATKDVPAPSSTVAVSTIDIPATRTIPSPQGEQPSPVPSSAAPISISITVSQVVPVETLTSTIAQSAVVSLRLPTGDQGQPAPFPSLPPLSTTLTSSVTVASGGTSPASPNTSNHGPVAPVAPQNPASPEQFSSSVKAANHGSEPQFQAKLEQYEGVPVAQKSSLESGPDNRQGDFPDVMRPGPDGTTGSSPQGPQGTGQSPTTSSSMHSSVVIGSVVGSILVVAGFAGAYKLKRKSSDGSSNTWGAYKGRRKSSHNGSTDGVSVISKELPEDVSGGEGLPAFYSNQENESVFTREKEFLPYGDYASRVSTPSQGQEGAFRNLNRDYSAKDSIPALKNAYLSDLTLSNFGDFRDKQEPPALSTQKLHYTTPSYVHPGIRTEGMAVKISSAESDSLFSRNSLMSSNYRALALSSIQESRNYSEMMESRPTAESRLSASQVAQMATAYASENRNTLSSTADSIFDLDSQHDYRNSNGTSLFSSLYEDRE